MSFLGYNWVHSKTSSEPKSTRYRLLSLNETLKCNYNCSRFFYTFKNIRECRRGNASKAIDHCSIAIVSRDLSRLRSSRAIMLCGKELVVNSCMRTEMHLLCIYRLKASYNLMHWFDATSFCERNKSQTM